MAVGVPGLGALDNPGHVATDAVGKRVDGMSLVCVYHPVAPQTLLGTRAHGLELSRGHAQLVDEVTRSASDAFFGVSGKLPGVVLLVVPLSQPVGECNFCVHVGRIGRVKIGTQGST